MSAYDAFNDDQSDSSEEEEDIILQAAAIAATGASLAVIEYSWAYYDKIPYRRLQQIQTGRVRIVRVRKIIQL